MKKIIFYLSSINITKTIIVFFTILFPLSVSAMAPGTLLYRTVADGKMYGYSGDPLLEVVGGILLGINPGHVGIYIGKQNGEDYVVEALAGGVIMTKAKYFVNEASGEKLVAAKLPKKASVLERLKAISLAKKLASQNLAYDFSFKKQKGPGSGEWTCVGLVEKIYESANIYNLNSSSQLIYNSENYAVDITPDGYDNHSIYNSDGDCLSTSVEFSKIARRKKTQLPAPEIIGYNAGLEYKGERYIFLPYTQLVQPSLKDELVDVELSSSFSDQAIRGKTPTVKILLRWSLVNNPQSSFKSVVDKGSRIVKAALSVFPSKDKTKSIVLVEEEADKQLLATSSNKVSVPIVINKATKETTIDYDNEKEDALNKEEEMRLETVSKVVINEASFVPVDEDVKTINLNTSTSVSIERKEEKAVKNDMPLVSLSKIVTVEPKPLIDIVATSSIEEPLVTLTTRPKEVNYHPSDLSVSKIAAGLKPSSSQTSSNTSNSLTQETPDFIATALISKIYATDNNDFIELYNPTDFDFDLAEAAFRLEKAKTADDPSLMIRIGNEADGLYPKGTVIKSKGYYLIVRDEASSYYLNMADAIATRNEFGWTGNGYIIYLGQGAISSSGDIDTVDAVGFGAAKYYQGSGPAFAITDNYFLNRIKNDKDNKSDFDLKVIADPDIVWEDSNNENSGSGNDSNIITNNDDNNNQPNDATSSATLLPLSLSEMRDAPDFSPLSFPEGQNSEGLNDLWHFSECYGENNYSSGLFGCSLELGSTYSVFSPSLSAPLDLNQSTISFNYRDSKNRTGYPRLIFKLANDSGQAVRLDFDSTLWQAIGLPLTAGRYYNSPIFLDQDWHSFSLVINTEQGYWAAYFDGVEKYRKLYAQTLASDFSFLEVSGDMNTVSFDELAIWRRSLTPEEIESNFSSSLPFTPFISRVSQEAVNLKYFWNFDEGYINVNEGGGIEAKDIINNLIMTLPENSWVWRGPENTGIINKWEADLEIAFPEPLQRKDMSLTFWWRSLLHPLAGRSWILLRYQEEGKMGLAADQYRRRFIFNGVDSIFDESSDGSTLPVDEAWHHFALTYDSYRHKLSLFVDGEIKKERTYIWIKDGEHPDNIILKSELKSIELDDLGVWEGTLTPWQVKKIYENTHIAS